jgi:hypothetical protein
MKRNVTFYLPWPTVSAYLASVTVQSTTIQPKRHGKPAAPVEMLKGGCLLYQLSRQPHGGAIDRMRPF